MDIPIDVVDDHPVFSAIDGRRTIDVLPRAAVLGLPLLSMFDVHLEVAHDVVFPAAVSRVGQVQIQLQ